MNCFTIRKQSSCSQQKLEMKSEQLPGDLFCYSAELAKQIIRIWIGFQRIPEIDDVIGTAIRIDEDVNVVLYDVRMMHQIGLNRCILESHDS